MKGRAKKEAGRRRRWEKMRRHLAHGARIGKSQTTTTTATTTTIKLMSDEMIKMMMVTTIMATILLSFFPILVVHHRYSWLTLIHSLTHLLLHT